MRGGTPGGGLHPLIGSAEPRVKHRRARTASPRTRGGPGAGRATHGRGGGRTPASGPAYPSSALNAASTPSV